MATLESIIGPDRVDNVSKLLVMVGFGFAGYGSYMHLTMGDRTLGNCLETGACNPWDPQWVLAPLVIGATLIFLAGGFDVSTIGHFIHRSDCR